MHGREVNVLKWYPETLETRPEIPSPFINKDGKELVVAFLKGSKKYVVFPVTVEKGTPLHYSRRTKWHFGKDDQLYVSYDFPELANTGLHSDSQLAGKKRITGLPVEVITCTGRPGAYSYAGFLARDEDIISVLRGDNCLVKKLGLTHPQLARPLFHVWNMMLKEIEIGRLRRFSDVQYFLYNGCKVLMRAEGTKGWQESIFRDEVMGKFDISVDRSLTEKEKTLLKIWYPGLSAQQMAEMENKLSHIGFSEMLPYYVMRYGFYEGHTSYRADPLAISFIFGLRTLEQLEAVFKGNLYTVLTRHFIASQQ
jgi:hypothetical protein